jgi:hypothetical protein
MESSGVAAVIMPNTSEEEINYEYLRNVILQFLEHKDRRVRPLLVAGALLTRVIFYSLVSSEFFPQFYDLPHRKHDD